MKLKQSIFLLFSVIGSMLYGQDQVGGVSIYQNSGWTLPMGIIRAKAAPTHPFQIARSAALGSSYTFGFQYFPTPYVGMDIGFSRTEFSSKPASLLTLNGIAEERGETYMEDFQFSSFYLALVGKYDFRRYSFKPSVAIASSFGSSFRADAYEKNDADQIIRTISYDGWLSGEPAEYKIGFRVDYRLLGRNYYKACVHMKLEHTLNNPMTRYTETVSDARTGVITNFTLEERNFFYHLYMGVGLSVNIDHL